MSEGLHVERERIILSNPGNPVELRQLSSEDASSYYSLIEYDRGHLSQFGDNTAEKYQSEKDVVQSITQPKDPSKYRFGMWVAGVLVGSDNLTPQSNQTAEIGSWVGAQYTGHNYAAHGRELLTDFAFRQLGMREVFSMIRVGNEASRKSVERSGFTLRATHGNIWVYVRRNPGLPE